MPPPPPPPSSAPQPESKMDDQVKDKEDEDMSEEDKEEEEQDNEEDDEEEEGEPSIPEEFMFEAEGVAMEEDMMKVSLESQFLGIFCPSLYSYAVFFSSVASRGRGRGASQVS